MMTQNECNLTGEIKDRISLQWTKKGIPFVEFILKISMKDHYKANVAHFIRCICHGPQAFYISEKIEPGEKISVKGSLDSRCRCFEEGYMYEITVAVKQCFPLKQSQEAYLNYSHPSL